MAHFAELGENNVVLQVIVVDNKDIKDTFIYVHIIRFEQFLNLIWLYLNIIKIIMINRYQML
jgi:hypothetical protein